MGIDQVLQHTRYHLNAKTNRFVCSPEHPMPKGATGRWEHTNAHETYYDGDCTAEYTCNACGHLWMEELPQ